jgi:integrase
MAKAAGLAPDEVARISGHSTRVGAACDLVRYGQQLPAIMQAGGWSSPAMVGRYSARLTVRQSAAAQVLGSRIAF